MKIEGILLDAGNIKALVDLAILANPQSIINQLRDIRAVTGLSIPEAKKLFDEHRALARAVAVDEKRRVSIARNHFLHGVDAY